MYVGENLDFAFSALHERTTKLLPWNSVAYDLLKFRFFCNSYDGNFTPGEFNGGRQQNIELKETF